MAKHKEKYLGIKMDYKQLGSSMLHQTLQLLNNAEGLDLVSMRRVNELCKATFKKLVDMEKRYIEGPQKLFNDALKAAGLDYQDGGEPPELDEEQTEKFKTLREAHDKEIEEFQKCCVYIDAVPLGPQHLEKIKGLTPARLDSLGPLYDEGGAVRTAAFKRKLGVV